MSRTNESGINSTQAEQIYRQAHEARRGQQMTGADAGRLRPFALREGAAYDQWVTALRREHKGRGGFSPPARLP